VGRGSGVGVGALRVVAVGAVRLAWCAGAFGFEARRRARGRENDLNGRHGRRPGGERDAAWRAWMPGAATKRPAWLRRARPGLVHGRSGRGGPHVRSEPFSTVEAAGDLPLALRLRVKPDGETQQRPGARGEGGSVRVGGPLGDGPQGAASPCTVDGGGAASRASVHLALGRRGRRLRAWLTAAVPCRCGGGPRHTTSPHSSATASARSRAASSKPSHARHSAR